MALIGNIIYSNRLLLRRICWDDIPCLVQWSNNKRYNGDFLTPERLTIEQALDHPSSTIFWNELNRFFIIALRNGPPIGTIHYWVHQEMRETAFIALRIALPEQRNLGYGTEAQKSLIMHLFTNTDINKVEMYTDIDNFAQQHCLMKLGFHEVASVTYDDHQIKRIGHLYRLTKENYQNLLVYKFHYE